MRGGTQVAKPEPAGRVILEPPRVIKPLGLS